jgi:hypothetical protein
MEGRRTAAAAAAAAAQGRLMETGGRPVVCVADRVADGIALAVPAPARGADARLLELPPGVSILNFVTRTGVT